LHFACNRQQGPYLLRNLGCAEILFDSIDQFVVPTQMLGCRRTVRKLAETAIVLRRNVGCDDFAFPWVSVLGPRNRTSANSRRALVLSGLIAMGPKMPGRLSGTFM
jgi:hypothetical protein